MGNPYSEAPLRSAEGSSRISSDLTFQSIIHIESYGTSVSLIPGPRSLGITGANLIPTKEPSVWHVRKGSPLAELPEGTLKEISGVGMQVGVSTLHVSNTGQHAPVPESAHLIPCTHGYGECESLHQVLGGTGIFVHSLDEFWGFNKCSALSTGDSNNKQETLVSACVWVWISKSEGVFTCEWGCVYENTCLYIWGSVYLCESVHVIEWEFVCLCVYVCVVRKRENSWPP